jgi:anaphase-promoting complex subunit 3
MKSRKSKLTKSDTPESGLTPMNEYQDVIGKLDKDEDRERTGGNNVQPAVVTTPNLSMISGQTPPSIVQQAVTLQKQSAEGLMSLLRTMGQAYVHLSSYECRAAIEVMESLPPNQKKTGWILSHLAKAYFELADYKQAVK